MRKLIIVLSMLILCCSLQAQIERGNIYGKVVDTEGVPLPGVTVTLDGTLTAPVSVVSGAKGLFRFTALPPADDYFIRVQLPAFKTKVISNIQVRFGKNVDITITLEVGILEEEVTVTAERPLIDKKKTEVGMVADRTILHELPVTRDRFFVEKLTPGVYSRYWNIGGQESGQQDAGSARGDPDHYNTTYSLDGIDITDMAARGSTYGGVSYDNVEEMNIIIGGAGDVTQQTSGLSSNVILKRGGNKMSLWFNVFFTDESFQGDNLTDELRAAGVEAMAKINQIKEFAFGLGGPIIKDKAWYYINWRNRDLKLFNVYGKADDSTGSSYAAKINLQPIPQNRFEFYLTGGIGGQSFGEDATTELPDGLLMGADKRFPRPFLKIMDEHTFGDNLYLSAQFVRQGGHNSVWFPMIDQERNKFAYWNEADRIWEGSTDGDKSARPHYRFQFLADYFNDNLLGVAHEIRIGVGYQKCGSLSESGYAGNVMARYNYNSPTVDYDGDGQPDIYPNIQRIEVERGTYSGQWTKYFALFLQDKISYKNFNFQLGLRYDYEYPYLEGRDILAVIKDHPAWKDHFTPGAIDAIDLILPGIQIDDIRGYDSEGNNYKWANLSPRFGFTWDIKGDGKNVLKAHAAAYYQWMSSSYASRWSRGGTGGWMDFWWLDGNSDGKYDVTELYWHRTSNYSLYRAFDDAGNFIGDLDDAAGIMYGSYNPLNPQETTDPYRLIDKETGAPRTLSLGVTFEKELFEDVAVTVSTDYRRYDKWNWYVDYFPDTGQIESKDWYMSAGYPPSNIEGIGSTKEASEHEWYVLKPEYGYTPWRFEKPRPDYYIDYYGVDFIFRKRLSNRWMLNASLTLGKQAAHFGDEGTHELTQTWALEGRGTTGRGEGETVRAGRYDCPRWMFKAAGIYQLPWWDIDISFTFNGRQGRKIQEYFDIVDYNLPNPRSISNRIWLVPNGTEHSDNVYLLNLRIQKRLEFENFGMIIFSFDLFNVFNASTIHWNFPKDHGTYTVQGSVFSPNPGFYHARDNFGPRVLRLGMSLKF